MNEYSKTIYKISFLIFALWSLIMTHVFGQSGDENDARALQAKLAMEESKKKRKEKNRTSAMNEFHKLPPLQQLELWLKCFEGATTEEKKIHYRNKVEVIFNSLDHSIYGENEVYEQAKDILFPLEQLEHWLKCFKGATTEEDKIHYRNKVKVIFYSFSEWDEEAETEVYEQAEDILFPLKQLELWLKCFEEATTVDEKFHYLNKVEAIFYSFSEWDKEAETEVYKQAENLLHEDADVTSFHFGPEM